jgi:hypothetical protein
LETHEEITLCKVLAYWEAFGINLTYKPADSTRQLRICLSQISFFKMVDLAGLLTMFVTEITPDSLYFDAYDVQPFRQRLFETRRATAEINGILRDMGYSNKSVRINNYDNQMEFNNDSIKNVMLYCGRLLHEWEIRGEEGLWRY